MRSPETAERRLRQGAADLLTTAAEASKSQLGDTEREFAHWQAGFKFGRQCGVDEGIGIGETRAAERLTAAITGCTETWNAPTQEKLRELRNDPPITSPCSKRCKWCVICRRYAQWWLETHRSEALAVHSAATR